MLDRVSLDEAGTSENKHENTVTAELVDTVPPLLDNAPSAASPTSKNGQDAFKDIIRYMIQAVEEANTFDPLTDEDFTMLLEPTDGWICEFTRSKPRVLNNTPVAAEMQAESEFAAALAELPELSGDLESL